VLAPDPTNSVAQLTAVFNANTAITAWVQALENAVIPPLDPVPDWYNPLNQALKTSQKNSTSWLSSTSPQIHSAISQSFIDYANLFFNTVTPLSNLVAQIKTNGKGVPTAGQQSELQSLVQLLLDQANKGLVKTTDLMTLISNYSTQMNSDRNTLLTALNGAIATQSADQEKIQQVQLQINALLEKIALKSADVSGKNISAGTGLVSVVVGMTFGIVLSGGVVALGSFASAVISIGVAAVMSEIYSDEVAEDYKQLVVLMGELSEDQMQLAMVNGVISNMQTLLNQNDQALRAFSSFLDVWNFAVYQLQSLLVVLAQPQINVQLIPDLNSLSDAVTAWQAIFKFSQDVQNATLLSAPPISFPKAVVNPGLALVSSQ